MYKLIFKTGFMRKNVACVNQNLLSWRLYAKPNLNWTECDRIVFGEYSLIFNTVDVYKMAYGISDPISTKIVTFWPPFLESVHSVPLRDPWTRLSGGSRSKGSENPICLSNSFCTYHYLSEWTIVCFSRIHFPNFIALIFQNAVKTDENINSWPILNILGLNRTFDPIYAQGNHVLSSS